MVSTLDRIRLIVEFICGAGLILFIAGIAFYSAFIVGPPMAFGMAIVFVLEIIHQVRQNS